MQNRFFKPRDEEKFKRAMAYILDESIHSIEEEIKVVFSKAENAIQGLESAQTKPDPETKKRLIAENKLALQECYIAVKKYHADLKEKKLFLNYECTTALQTFRKYAYNNLFKTHEDIEAMKPFLNKIEQYFEDAIASRKSDLTRNSDVVVDQNAFKINELPEHVGCTPKCTIL